jgi:hypothetical protein
MSIRIYACPTWEYAANAHVLKLQRLQNRVLHAIGKPWQPRISPRKARGFQNSLHVWLQY